MTHVVKQSTGPDSDAATSRHPAAADAGLAAPEVGPIAAVAPWALGTVGPEGRHSLERFASAQRNQAILALQRTQGNRQVQRLLQRQAPQSVIQRGPPTTGPATGPKKTLSGKPALDAVGKLLPTSAPITVTGGAMGSVDLVPGAIWSDKLLVYAGPLQVYYVEGDDLYEAYTPDFIRDHWLTGLAKGVASAKWIIPLAKAEFALITALVAPWYLVGGLGIVKAFAYYADNKALVHLAARNAGAVIALVKRLEARYPSLFKKLVWQGMKEAIKHFPEGIELHHILYFVGRVIGVGGVVGKIEAGVEVTAKVLLILIAEYAFLVTLLHSPEIAAKGIEEAVRKSAEDLRVRLEAAGIPVTVAEARRIVQELSENPGSDQLLSEFKQANEALVEAIRLLEKARAKMFD